MAMDPLQLALTPRLSVPRRTKLPPVPEAKRKELEKLQQACRDFESIFTYQMLKSMRQTVPQTKLIHGGNAEDIFADMLDQERSKEFSKQQSFGMADLLYSQLSRAVLSSGGR
jgi:peptidoglycan hydrolase FlgJ